MLVVELAHAEQRIWNLSIIDLQRKENRINWQEIILCSEV